jgi:hypothetical protein
MHLRRGKLTRPNLESRWPVCWVIAMEGKLRHAELRRVICTRKSVWSASPLPALAIVGIDERGKARIALWIGARA